MKKTLTLKQIVGYLSLFAFGALLMLPSSVLSQTIRAAGDLLQVGDVKTSHILNGTIVDVDVSNTALISATKVSPRGLQGAVLLSDGTNIATSTTLRFSTTTNTLSIIGGRISATTTSFNGVNMTWPSADGGDGQVLKTNGAGAYSYTDISALAYGDGGDGVVTIAAMSTTTLTRDMYYDTLTVDGELVTGNFRIFVKNTLSGTGAIVAPAANNGANASGTTGGAGGATTTSGYVKGEKGTNGANGGTGAGGNPGDAGWVSLSFGTSTGAVGGAGGDGSSNPAGDGGAGGAAGTQATTTRFGVFAYETTRLLEFATSTRTHSMFVCGPQSTGGGSGNDNDGGGTGGGAGGGGATGNWVIFFAKTWGGSFTIRALGGNGGTGGAGTFTVDGAGGGGGGGNGGCVVAGHGTKTWTGLYQLTGGSGGAGGSSGGGGGNGNAGATGKFGTYHEVDFDLLTR